MPSEQWRTDTSREETRLERGRLTIDEFGFLNGCPFPGGERGEVGVRGGSTSPTVPRRGRGDLIALPQFFDDGGGEAELGLREALKDVLELN